MTSEYIAWGVSLILTLLIIYIYAYWRKALRERDAAEKSMESAWGVARWNIEHFKKRKNQPRLANGRFKKVER